MHHICTYWYINTNTNSPTPHTHSQKFRHICTPMFISLYVENTSSYWYLQFNTIIPQGHSSFLTFRICDLLSNSEKPVPTILICLLIWSLPVLANFLPLLPFLLLHWNHSHPAWARTPYTMPLPLSPTWKKPLLPCSWSGTCTKPSPIWLLSSLCWGSGTHHGVIPLCGHPLHTSGSEPPFQADPHMRLNSHGLSSDIPYRLPLMGIPSLPCLGSDNPFGAMGATPTLTWVPTCSAKKEKVPPFTFAVLHRKR